MVAVSDEFEDENSVIPLIEEAEDIEYIKECDEKRVVWIKSDGSLFGKGKLILDAVMDTLEMKIHI